MSNLYQMRSASYSVLLSYTLVLSYRTVSTVVTSHLLPSLRVRGGECPTQVAKIFLIPVTGNGDILGA